MLRTWFPRFRKRSVPPWGLEPDQVNLLTGLIQTPGWKAYSKALEAHWDSQTERFLAGLPADDYHQMVGYLKCLRKVLSLPDDIVLASQPPLKERVTHDRTNTTDASRTRFFGTSWFSPTDT